MDSIRFYRLLTGLLYKQGVLMSSRRMFLEISLVGSALLAFSPSFSPSLRADTLVPLATTAGTQVFTPSVSAFPNYYTQSEVGGGNTNGAPLSFSATFNVLFGDVGQYGLTDVYVPPGGSPPNPPTDTAWNNTVSGPVAAGTVAWAIDSYSPGGPANPSSVPIESVLRGSGIVITSSPDTYIDGILTLTVAGDLYSDGYVYSNDPSVPPTSLASLGISSVLPFTGLFTDNVATDPTLSNLTGSFTIYADYVNTPEPAPLALLMSGLACPIGLWFYRKRFHTMARELTAGA
jgi:hypothetical protein